MTHASVTDRVRGCLLAGAVGDALGAPVEFDSGTDIERQVGPLGVRDYLPSAYGKDLGLITDDTQMTLFTVDALLRADSRLACKGLWSPLGVTEFAYQRWLDTQKYRSPSDVGQAAMGRVPRTALGWLGEQSWLYARRAPGNTCLSALEDARHNGSGQARNNSKGCGGVMRSAPYGLLAFRGVTPTDIASLAVSGSAITHGHPTGQIASGAFAHIVALLVNDMPLRDAVEETLHTWLDGSAQAEETARALRNALHAATTEPPSRNLVEALGGGWIAEEALAIGVYAALAYSHPDEMLDALALAVTHSGDSDSTGSICGNLLGVIHGEQAVPTHLLEQLEGRDTITALADDFSAMLTETVYTDSTHVGLPDEWLDKYPPG